MRKFTWLIFVFFGFPVCAQTYPDRTVSSLSVIPSSGATVGVKIGNNINLCLNSATDCLLHTGSALAYQPSGATVAGFGDANGGGYFGVAGVAGAATLAMKAGGSSRTWVGLSDNGLMTYFDTTGTLNAYSLTGQLGLVGASRTSDGTNTASIAIAGMGRLNSSGNNGAWGAYIRGVRDGNYTGGSALGIEINSANAGPLVNNSSYNAAPGGVTSALWLSVGGETANSGTTVYPSSSAMSIVSNGGTSGSLWNKGIVFQFNALSVANSTTGMQVAEQLGKNQEIEWVYDGTEVRTGFIRSTGGQAGLGILFTNYGLSIVNNNETSTLASFDPSGNLTIPNLNRNVEFVSATAAVTHAITTDTSFAIAQSTSIQNFTSSGTVASYTVTLPNDYTQGHIVTLTFDHTVTALTVSPPAGAGISGAPTTIGPTTPASFYFDAASGFFRRIS